MADADAEVQNGPVLEQDEDTFERDLKEMLKDAPTLNDMSNTVQGGNPKAGEPGGQQQQQQQPHVYMKPHARSPDETSPRLPTSLPQSSIPRSHTVPPATTNIPLSSPDRNGHNGGNAGMKPRPISTAQANSSKLDSIKNWSLNTYKCTRQLISERFGKGSKTVDLELESQIEALRDTQRKYSNILRLARALTNHFYHVVQTQRALGDSFSDLSQKNPELQEEFSYNAETQKALCKNGETLLGALNFFTSSVNTLCNKTMEDTLQTIKQYETARIEFDAYRTDVEQLNLGPRDSNTVPKIEDAQKKFGHHKEKFDRLRGDVGIKLKFLEENKVKVMHKQLLLFHNAVSAYFSGNQGALESTLKQFNIKLKAPNTGKPSWIEQ